MKCAGRESSISCACTYERCSRKGRCCDCLKYHLSANELPACVFTAKTEKTYDRSFNSFINDRGGMK